MKHLNRDASGLPGDIWDLIDEAAQKAAKKSMVARRFLDMDGAYGPGLTSIELGADDFCRQPREDEAGAVVSRAISVPMLRKSCGISVRRVEAYLNMGQPLNLAPVEDAAEAVARREDEFIFYGQEAFGLEGLLTAKQAQHSRIDDWSKVEQALDDVLTAVDKLDGAGFHGPYALALSPNLYNQLFRRYEGTDMLQLEHLKRLCELGVFKAPINEAVLVDVHVGDLVVGQDLMTGYSATDGIHYQLFVSESLVLRLQEPDAICRLSSV